MICFFCLIFQVFVVSSTFLDIPIDKDGNFEVVLGKKTKFLQSASTAFYNEGEWYSSKGDIGKGNKLSLLNLTTGTGKDKHGTYSETSMLWETAADRNSIRLETTVIIYDLVPAVVFVQRFPEGMTGTLLNDKNDVISSFPAFQVFDSIDGTLMNYLEYYKTFFVPHVGQWHSSTSYKGGYQYGPLTLFDEDLDTLVISPMDNFMVGSVVRDSKSISTNVACGIGGKISEIPKGFEHKTLLFAAQGSVWDAMRGWGDFLMKEYGKERVQPEDEIFLQYLSYWTDTGAYYWYLTEEGKNYEDTVLDIWKHIQDIGLPVKLLNYDSWWYPKDKPEWGGMLLWEPTKEAIPHGFEWLDQQVGVPLVLHSKFFSNMNEYLTKMNYTFHVQGALALPKKQDVYDHMFSVAKSYHLSMIKQDWLSSQTEQLDVITDNLHFGREWLTNEATAALKQGMTIQWCMAYPSHIMQTVQIPGKSVTNARASPDFQPQNDNWAPLGMSSMFLWALGLYPFKDTYWSSTELEEGCTYSHCQDYNAVPQQIISVMSAGPVGPGDKIGFFEKDLILETCRADGKLLKPDRPMLAVDAVFAQSFQYEKPQIKVWSTFNCFELVGCYFYVLALDLQEDFTFSPDMLPTDSPSPEVEAVVESYLGVLYKAGQKQIEVFKFDKDNAHVFEKNYDPRDGRIGYEMITLVPVVKNAEWLFLGELAKITAAAKERITKLKIEEESSSLEMKIEGKEDEVVHLSFYNTSEEKVVYLDCKIRAHGSVDVKCGISSHTCVC